MVNAWGGSRKDHFEEGRGLLNKLSSEGLS